MTILFLFILLTGIILAKIIFDTNYFQIQIVRLRSNKIQVGAGLRILQISDLHNKVFGSRNERLVHTAKQLKPDLIVITGDLISRHTKEFSDVFHLVEQLPAITRHVYFVSGNHEWDNAHMASLLRGLRERNVTVLDNENTRIEIGGTTVQLAGVADSSTNHEDVERAFQGVNHEPYTILLSHCPYVVHKYDKLPADFILSGHTHGGQIRLPLIGAIIAPGTSLFPKIDKGIFKLGMDRYLYIDSGLGTSRLPIRFCNQSQVSFITIVRDNI